MDIPGTLEEIRSRMQLSQERLAQTLGVSFVSINRWERGASSPSPAMAHRIAELYQASHDLWGLSRLAQPAATPFSSRGVRHRAVTSRPLFADVIEEQAITLSKAPLPPLLSRLTNGQYFSRKGKESLLAILRDHESRAPSVSAPPAGGMSAGKNTYTYDAHTYHTKVPPQGIAELLKHYLPEDGLVLDPFAGSGMAGVACRVLGYDSILNELSPAACFIAS